MLLCAPDVFFAHRPPDQGVAMDVDEDACGAQLEAEAGMLRSSEVSLDTRCGRKLSLECPFPRGHAP
ncbi:MAG: hypothetical protein VX589_01030 [Myxococcota bacterium]|nr:hypothetical protein [Myxococcota bacterium]